MTIQVSSTLLPQPYPSASTKAGEGSAIPLAVLLGLAVAGFGSSHPYEGDPQKGTPTFGNPPFGEASGYRSGGVWHDRALYIEVPHAMKQTPNLNPKPKP